MVKTLAATAPARGLAAQRCRAGARTPRTNDVINARQMSLDCSASCSTRSAGRFLRGCAWREAATLLPRGVSLGRPRRCLLCIVLSHGSCTRCGMACCYLLRSQPSPQRSYIGYTVDIDARLSRHNGLMSGGAKPTQKHRPWEYVCVVSGFASDTAAKCFEYAWQQPRTPWTKMAARLRLKGLMGATRAYSALRALIKDLPKDSDTVVWNLRVLAVMLGMEQWQGLTVQFAHAADKARARAAVALAQPGAVLRGLVQPFSAVAAGAERARGVRVAAAGALPAARGLQGKKRPRQAFGSDEVVIVED